MSTPVELHLTRRSGQVQLPMDRPQEGVWSVSEGDDLCLIVRASEPAEASLAGTPLPLEGISRVGGDLESRFRLRIETWAGRSLVLVRAGTAEHVVVLDVQPHPGKLGREAFRELLEELSAISKDLPWGLGPGQHGAARDERSPAVVHPSVIENELPELLAALRRLRADPLPWTERVRALERLPANRRVDPATFRWLVSHPRALEAVRPSTPAGRRTDYGVSIEQPLIRTTPAHPATRYVRYLLERLLHLLRENASRLASLTREPRAGELARVLTRAADEVKDALGTTPFRDVRAEPPSPTSLQAVMDHPEYARVQHLARRLLDPGLRLDEQGALLASLRYTYDLFELFVLYRLGSGLARALGLSWRCTSQPPRSNDILESPPEGCTWEGESSDGLTLELHYQRKFRSWSTNRAPFQSLSSERYPDYVLLLSRKDQPLCWLLLDAKYRSSREAIHDGLADMHVYRDSLRWNQRPARAGFILVPRLRDNASIYASRDYHETHRFGAIALHEEDWLRPILVELQVALSA